tara:strand:+ start:2802 stop:3056 length:255 start_codon:yes stop_codon:yes gene_type:complete
MSRHADTRIYCFTCKCGYEFKGSEAAERMAFRLHGKTCTMTDRTQQRAAPSLILHKNGTYGMDCMHNPWKYRNVDSPMYYGNKK